jgi:hypothetical protein
MQSAITYPYLCGLYGTHEVCPTPSMLLTVSCTLWQNIGWGTWPWCEIAPHAWPLRCSEPMKTWRDDGLPTTFKLLMCSSPMSQLRIERVKMLQVASTITIMMGEHATSSPSKECRDSASHIHKFVPLISIIKIARILYNVLVHSWQCFMLEPQDVSMMFELADQLTLETTFLLWRSQMWVHESLQIDLKTKSRLWVHSIPRRNKKVMPIFVLAYVEFRTPGKARSMLQATLASCTLAMDVC